MTAWFDHFFDGLYGRVLPESFPASTTAWQVKVIRRLLRLRRGQRVLDVPCGTGRIAIPMAATGVQVTGVDLTGKYLARAKRDARKAGVAVKLIHSDMRNIDFEGELDGVFNWFGSFGYFSDRDNLRFCKRVYRALKPGRRFLFEGINKSWLVSHMKKKTMSDIGGVHIEQRHKFDPARSRIHSWWTFRRGGREEHHHISMRMYNGAELRGLLRAAGFRDIELYEQGPQPKRFTRHSRRYIVIGRKPRKA